MICVTIAQASRRLALADMLNAAAMGADLLEVRLDSFAEEPDPKELLGARRKPVIFSCRRAADGGNWRGTEDDRLKLLKTGIIAQPDYCVLEMDIADQVRRFGPTQRIISYTNLKETPADIAEIYEEARKQDPDIIKLTCRARTPEEAWPLIQLLVKPPVPTVVVGLGRPGIMLAILGRKIGAPFTLAALEKGMEAFPGQPTVHELEHIYHYRAIDKSTKLVGVTGVGEREHLTMALLNSAFARLQQPMRCLPLQVGNVKLFRKVIEAVKLLGVVVEEAQQDALREIAAEVDADVQGVTLNAGGAPVEHAADLLVQRDVKVWQGAHTFAHAAVAALEATLAGKGKELRDAMVLLVGLGPSARSLARVVKERGGRFVFASTDRNASARFCRLFGGRQIMMEGVYTTMHDVLLVCPDASGSEPPDLHPGVLKPATTVMDVTDIPRMTTLLREALLRGCAVVPPGQLLIEQVRAQVKRLTGQEIALAPLEETLAGLVDEE